MTTRCDFLNIYLRYNPKSCRTLNALRARYNPRGAKSAEAPPPMLWLLNIVDGPLIRSKLEHSLSEIAAGRAPFESTFVDLCSRHTRGKDYNVFCGT